MKEILMDWLRGWLSPELVWFFVGLLLLLVELTAPGLVFIFFAFGAWVVAVVCLFTTLSLNVQLGLFLIVSVLSLLLARSWVKGIFSGHITSRQNPNADLNDFLGQHAVVTKKIMPKLPGKVEFRGTPWLAAADQEIAEGTVVEVVGKDNLTLKVKVA
jgi:membrane protein implicated in regulation of membrane protease activity